MLTNASSDIRIARRLLIEFLLGSILVTLFFLPAAAKLTSALKSEASLKRET